MNHQPSAARKTSHCVRTAVASLLVALSLVSQLPARAIVPVALGFSADGRQLFVANRDGRSISVLNAQTRKLSCEIEVPGKPIDLLVLGQQLVVLDAQHSQLRVMDLQGKIVAEHDLFSLPRRMISNATDNQIYIASTFSNEIISFSLEGKQWKATSRCKLPFSPLELKWVRGRLIATGAFEANIAVLDCSDIEVAMPILRTASLRGHNIRGIEIVDDEIYLSMQELNPLAHSTRDDVHWGNLLANKLVHFPLQDLLGEPPSVGSKPEDPPSQDYIDVDLEHFDVEIGQPEHGSGDPGRLLYEANQNTLFVLLAGSSELIAFDTASEEVQTRIQLDAGPSAIACYDKTIVIASRFADSLTWFDSAETASSLTSSVSSLSKSDPNALQRGEQLFFDSRLSHDGWMSCHSCHSDGHSSGQLNDNQSDGGFGAAKRIPSLLGVGSTSPWGWTGKVKTLTQQTTNSVRQTMHGDALDASQVDDLVEFMESLVPPKLTAKITSAGSGPQRAEGERLFRELGCATCHRPEKNFTSPKTYEIGWEDRQGNRRFNPPSLSGLRLRTRIFHDGRSNLNSMLENGEHMLDRELNPAEQASLLKYLRGL